MSAARSISSLFPFSLPPPLDNNRYFVGSPLDKGDLERVQASKASMIFVIADFQTENTVAEDQSNIIFATGIQRMYPDRQYRLMLVGMPALSVCSQASHQ